MKEVSCQPYIQDEQKAFPTIKYTMMSQNLQPEGSSETPDFFEEDLGAF
jgi:hypothetical protein